MSTDRRRVPRHIQRQIDTLREPHYSVPHAKFTKDLTFHQLVGVFMLVSAVIGFALVGAVSQVITNDLLPNLGVIVAAMFFAAQMVLGLILIADNR